ncbi:ROK family transcriptional regulator [Micromonospora sp. KC213]|uniref:ROK family transcriptional regulator n=1 Tax=Micromonospora sp. KC213 TaxID=2530378 RepID=UPI001A9D9B61|nr:ROK family transcriptional regulator [Micromonospora sp. KC213]
MPIDIGAPMRHATMRERNLAVLLGVIAEHQPATRAQLAALTGFTKTTVSNLIAVLADAGLVHNGGMVHDGDRGRPGTGVLVDGAGAAGLGLEVTVDYLAACVLDLGRRVRYRHLVTADNRNRRPEEIAAALSLLAGKAIGSAQEQGLTVAGAVVAVPGLLDRSGMLRAPSFRWRDVPAATLLDRVLRELRLPTKLENEANLAALGELWFGAGRPLGDFLHVSGEIGIGAGIILNGRIFRGFHGFAGELGHIQVDPDGPQCACGACGCLELVAGREAMLRAVGLEPLTAWSGLDEQISALIELLEAGDRGAMEVVRRAGDALGRALTCIVKGLDPGAIVLGGTFSRLAAWILQPTEAALRAGALYEQTPTVVISPLGGDAVMLGAAGQVIEDIYADPAVLLR